VQQREQDIPHVRVSVKHASGAVQRCRILDSAPELAIRDPHRHGVRSRHDVVVDQ
jgi:hypothetical protein